jgi:hypothetical protein
LLGVRAAQCGTKTFNSLNMWRRLNQERSIGKTAALEQYRCERECALRLSVLVLCLSLLKQETSADFDKHCQSSWHLHMDASQLLLCSSKLKI